VEFEQPTGTAKVSAALAGEHVTVVADTEEGPNNVNAAGQGDILVSVTPDSADAHSVWLWAASDNFRVAATAAVDIAESMAATRPRGQIQ
jgi:aspartate-semialdehyde dehydrogenase